MKIESYTNEKDWLEARRKGVGSSDISRLVFGTPQGGPWTCWNEKVNGYEQKRGKDELAEMGHWLEPVNAARFEEVTKKTLHDPGDFTLIWHESLPMFSTLDRVTPQHTSWEMWEAIVELKAAFGDNARLIERVTTHDMHHTKLSQYFWQVQHMMACTGLGEAYFSILYFTGFSAGHRWFHCKRDDKVIRAIEKRVKQFWKCVETGEPPDWRLATSADQAAIRAMRLPEGDRVLEIEGEADFTEFSKLTELHAEKSSVTKRFNDAKAKWEARMKAEGVTQVIAGDKQIDRRKGKTLIKDYREDAI